MQPRLVGEGGGADVRRGAEGDAVQDVVEEAGGAGEALEVFLGDACFETAFVGFLEEERGDQRGEVRVPAALAEAVERALDLADARVDGGERVRDRVAGVVVAVDAEAVARDARGDDVGGDAGDFRRKRAAVRVAEDDPAGAGVERRRGGRRGRRSGLAL